jgi:hypothetical protein
MDHGNGCGLGHPMALVGFRHSMIFKWFAKWPNMWPDHIKSDMCHVSYTSGVRLNVLMEFDYKD